MVHDGFPLLGRDRCSPLFNRYTHTPCLCPGIRIIQDAFSANLRGTERGHRSLPSAALVQTGIDQALSLPSAAPLFYIRISLSLVLHLGLHPTYALLALEAIFFPFLFGDHHLVHHLFPVPAPFERLTVVRPLVSADRSPCRTPSPANPSWLTTRRTTISSLICQITASVMVTRRMILSSVAAPVPMPSRLLPRASWPRSRTAGHSPSWPTVFHPSA